MPGFVMSGGAMVTEGSTVADCDEALTHMAAEHRTLTEHDCRHLVLDTYIDKLLDRRLELSRA